MSSRLNKPCCRCGFLNFTEDMHTTFPQSCPACWTPCHLFYKWHYKAESGIVNVRIFWIFLGLLVDPLCVFIVYSPDTTQEMVLLPNQIRSWARLRITLKAPRSKPEMLSKPLSSVSAMACPIEVRPHITSFESAPDACWRKKTELLVC